MTEQTYTGGTRKFVRKKGEKPEKDPKLEAEIEEGYEKSEIRKRKNKMIRNTAIITIIFILIAAGIIVFLF